MAIEIVDLPMKNGDFPSSLCKRLPEGIQTWRCEIGGLLKNRFIQLSLGFLWIFTIIKYCCKAKYMSQLGWFSISQYEWKVIQKSMVPVTFRKPDISVIFPLLVYSLLTTNNQGSKPCSKHQALDGRLESHLGRCPLLGLHKVGTATWWTSQGLKWTLSFVWGLLLKQM